ncbi:hypothetical protein ACJX0J_012152 [Zea mays]
MDMRELYGVEIFRLVRLLPSTHILFMVPSVYDVVGANLVEIGIAMDEAILSLGNFSLGDFLFVFPLVGGVPLVHHVGLGLDGMVFPLSRSGVFFGCTVDASEYPIILKWVIDE